MEDFFQNLKVKKRDGRIVDFDANKIKNAVNAAANSLKVSLPVAALETIVEDVLASIAKDFKPNIPYDIENIQDKVEDSLIRGNYSELAKIYILYRDNRTRARNTNSVVNKTITDLVMVDSKDLDAKRENANINGDSTIN